MKTPDKMIPGLMTTETPQPPTPRIDRAALPISVLALPILLEQFFRILVSSIDVVMISSFSQQAVAGIGLTVQYIFFLQILFNVICIGTSIVLAQYLGAQRHHESKQVVQASIVMITLVASFICVLVSFGAGALLSLYSIEDEVRRFAWEYFVIFGGVGSLFTAFNMLQGTVLRSYGYTRSPMYISFIANIINVAGNALSLYGWFGLPVLGVKGVAASSVFSQVVACILLASVIRKNPEIQFSLSGILKVPSKIYTRILSIGVPTAGENMAYNVAQIVLMVMISALGTFAMSAQIYTQTIVRFVFVATVALGNAVQIKMGYFVGAKRPDEAYRRLYQYQAAGTAITLVLIIAINIFKTPIISLFTTVPEISSLVYTLLLYSIYIEFGRSLNLITIQALKGAGDIRFPVLYGLFSMWGIMVLGSWILGIQMGMGLVGIWIATGTDETTRGIVMLFRWKSKRWQAKAIQ